MNLGTLTRRLSSMLLAPLLALNCSAPEQQAPLEQEHSEATEGLEESEIPQFRVDPFWARELPSNWMLGQVSGIAVDDRDHIWVLHRPRTLDPRQRGEEGMCCVPAPPSSNSTRKAM